MLDGNDNTASRLPIGYHHRMGPIMDAWLLFVVAVAGWMNREQSKALEYLLAENAVLKEHLKKNGRLRCTEDQRRRLAVKAKELGRAALKRLDTIVTPDTLLLWHRQLIANVLARYGIEPAPERLSTWKQFLKTHWDVLAATDFVTVEVWHPVGLVRYHVLFVIALAMRRVHIVGIAHDPGSEWMEQMARNLTDAFDGFLLGKRYLICDRDRLFTARLCEILAAAGVETVRLPPRSPNLNPHAERFVLSIKIECLNHLIVFSEGQLRRACKQLTAHYHKERNHQGLGNQLIDCSAVAANDNGELVCDERLGGLLKFYRRAA